MGKTEEKQMTGRLAFYAGRLSFSYFKNESVFSRGLIGDILS